ncbi:MAG: dATP pyrophosphohydrolase [Pseudomonadota bacterium]
MAGLEIRAVHDRAEMARFIALPERLYDGQAGFVAPLRLERGDALSRAKNPYFEHAKAEYWLAWRDGRPVGRISAQIDELTQVRHGAGLGQFGCLDAEDDPAIFQALTGAAEAWLKDAGMTRCQGPFSLSINQQCGLLVEGYDEPPMMMMDFAPPYAAQRLAEQGYAKVMDLLAYDYTAEQPPPPGAEWLERLTADGRVVLRRLDKGRYRQELDVILDIFNDAWSENWGFVPFTEAEMSHIAAELKPILRPEMVWIAEIEGEAIAMIVCLPNLAEAFEGLSGKLLPFGWLKLLWRLKVKGLKSGRVVMMGLRKAHHGSPIGSAIVLMLIEELRESLIKIGYRRAEMSWILEDNWRMRAVIEGIGGRHSKTYRIYEKALT